MLKHQSKIFGIGAALLVLGGLYYYLTTEQKSFSQNDVYINKDYGFGFTIPQVWRELTYKIEESDNKYGGRNFEFVVPFTNERGEKEYGFTLSFVSAIPLDYYNKNFPLCKEGEELCVEPEKLSSNSRYQFVSHTISPEAFGSCYTGQENKLSLFGEKNKLLCKSGPFSKYPERTSFNALD